GRHLWLMRTLGEGGANFVEHGISSLVPIDVSARLGMGNLIPGTELFKKSSTDKTRGAVELFGPAGSVVSGAVKAFDGLGTGKNFSDIIKPVAPKAFNDLMQAIDILQTGYYRDSRGRKVVEAGASDAFFKAIGFQPNVVAEPRRVQWMVGQSSEMHRSIMANIHELWAMGVFEHDQDKILVAKRKLTDWNQKNPETPIRLNPTSIAQRVRAMRASSSERMVNATRKEVRGMVKDAIELAY
ncbi:MAG: PLxRFG domain-containing protein, partial [Azovibrio sp.]